MERFLGSHFANLRLYARRVDLDDLVEQARILCGKMTHWGFQTAVLVLDPEYLTRAIADTRSRRNEAWAAFLDGLGPPNVVAEHFAAWQSELLLFYDRIGLDANVRYHRVDARERLPQIARDIGRTLCRGE